MLPLEVAGRVQGGALTVQESLIPQLRRACRSGWATGVYLSVQKREGAPCCPDWSSQGQSFTRGIHLPAELFDERRLGSVGCASSCLCSSATRANPAAFMVAVRWRVSGWQ